MSDITNKKQRTKRSRIWTIPTEQFKKIVETNETYSGILNDIGYTKRGNAFNMLKLRILNEAIDDSHILKNGQQIAHAQRFNKKSDDEIFIVNSTYNCGANIRKRLIERGVLDKCSVCGLDAEWNGKALMLQVDHINGIRNDNRLENLRLICPNCHSQTDTFAGRRNALRVKICPTCGGSMSGYKSGQNCRQCFNESPRYSLRKVVRPTKQELNNLIWEFPTSTLAKQYGVSDKAIEKWCKLYGIEKPKRGYWAKKNAKKI